MNLRTAIGMVSSIAMLLPIVVILISRLLSHRTFIALLVYYLVVSIQTMMRLEMIAVPKSTYQFLGIVDNLIDAPLMLIFLTLFSTSARMTKRLMNAAFAFAGFELIVIAFTGFTVDAVKIVLGPDIIVVTSLGFIFFLRNVKLAVTNSKAMGKTLMSCSVLVSYTFFFLVYIFYYLVRNEQYRKDAQLIFYLVSIIAALLMALGIVIENKRIKKLDELKHTRKELAIIYGESNVRSFNSDSRLAGSNTN